MDSLETQARRLEDLVPQFVTALAVPQELDAFANLTPGQLRLVRALQRGPRALSDLAAELHMSSSAATQLVQRLEDVGIVERRQDCVDRRVRRVSLSEAGLVKLEDWTLRRRERAKALLQMLPTPDRENALEFLERMASTLESPQ